MKKDEMVLFICAEEEMTLEDFLSDEDMNIPGAFTETELEAIKNLQVGQTWIHDLTKWDVKRIK